MKAYTFQIAIVACATILSLPVSSHETEEKIPDPGFRPESSLAAPFLKAIKTSTISVYPSIVRTFKGTSFSDASQKQVVAFLKKNKMAKAITTGKKVDPGKMEGQAQWALFQNDMKAIAQEITSRKSVSDYILVMEFLVAPPRNGETAVGGIHCFILDKKGENAFSFLLNSHHKLFIDANLSTADTSEKGQAALLEKSTEVVLKALAGQIHDAEKSSKEPAVDTQ